MHVIYRRSDVSNLISIKGFCCDKTVIVFVTDLVPHAISPSRTKYAVYKDTRVIS